MNLPHTTALRPPKADGWIRLVAMLSGLTAQEVAHMSLFEALRVIDYRSKDRARSR